MNGLLAVVGLVAAQGPSTDYRDAFLGTVEAMKLPGMDVTPVVEQCGEVNAYYSPRTHEIVLCVEALGAMEPELVRAVTAHEMAHAIIDQYHIPVPGSEEVAADELSVVYLGRTDHVMAILKAGLFFAEHPRLEDVWDDHPGNARRAATLMCFGDGADKEPLIAECQHRFEQAVNTWTRLLSTFAPRTEE